MLITPSFSSSDNVQILGDSDLHVCCTSFPDCLLHPQLGKLLLVLSVQIKFLPLCENLSHLHPWELADQSLLCITHIGASVRVAMMHVIIYLYVCLFWRH